MMAERPALYPEWFASCLVGDDVFAAAYGSIGDEGRTRLKLAIARLVSVFGADGAMECESTSVMRQGFVYTRLNRPVDWAVCFCSELCESPARLLAAIVPALAAGVPNIAVCRVAGLESSARETWPPAMLTALELAGVEHVASLPLEKALLLLRNMADTCLPGRVVLLGESGLRELAGAAGGVACRMLPERVTIGIDAEGLPEDFNPPSYGMLRFAQPDATFVPAESGIRECHAVVCAETAVAAWARRCRLVLSPGHESLWLWPGIDPAFFMESHAGFRQCL